MWERLDRMLGNSRWLHTFPFTLISHLAMSSSDHRPLLCSIQNAESPKRSLFRFQNMWILHPNFIEKIAKNKVLNMEIEVKRGVCSEFDLHKANEELLMQINYSKHFLKQKAAVTKFTVGDRNSSFYNACNNFRRKNKMILSITDYNGHCLSDDDAVAQDVVCHFHDIFNDQPTSRTQINTELLSDC
ncbi:uncharacterized protein LOC110019907 [Phalaenopsis equestris]|uniref:uncharacterized protein LOC110019907 n=1 Tax=Phalaenopsis equestris TaxID=78828 RepID=UPI0009E57B14|nr:uncharacterized protein LOC110019907 [Phalaenopsis equestris]